MKNIWHIIWVCGCLVGNSSPLYAEVSDGPVTTYYPDDVTINEEKNYVNGKLEGKYTKHYSNGSLELVGNYVNDKEEGKFIYYDKEGHLIRKAIYERGVLHGKAEEYFEDGSIKSEVYYENNVLNGPFKLYDANGNNLVDAKYKNGILDGKYAGIGFYGDGEVLPVRELSDPMFNGSDTEYENYIEKILAFESKINELPLVLNKKSKEEVYAFAGKIKLRLNGDFNEGKFSGALSFYEVLPVGTRKTTVKFTDGALTEFDGCLNSAFTQTLYKIDRYLTKFQVYGKEKSALCGKGTIKDRQLTGKFENISYDERLNFVIGEINSDGFTGYIMEENEKETRDNNRKRTFYTYKNGILDGPTFDISDNYIEKYATMKKGRRIPDKEFEAYKYNDGWGDMGILEFIKDKLRIEEYVWVYDYGEGKYVSYSDGKFYDENDQIVRGENRVDFTDDYAYSDYEKSNEVGRASGIIQKKQVDYVNGNNASFGGVKQNESIPNRNVVTVPNNNYNSDDYNRRRVFFQGPNSKTVGVAVSPDEYDRTHPVRTDSRGFVIPYSQTTGSYNGGDYNRRKVFFQGPNSKNVGVAVSPDEYNRTHPVRTDSRGFVIH